MQMLVCLAGLTVCVATQLPAQAAGGDITISRQVQPRAAARQELVPDPNPQVVNPSREKLINSSLSSGLAPLEMSDSDFAGVHAGSRMGNGVPLSHQGDGHPPGAGAVASQGRSSVAGMNPVGRGAGTAGRAGGQVSRSVQQGLRPLQTLQGQ
ncbi:hypothetical protein CQ007_08775 [Pseudomonas sp. MYb185]|nr:hypothetical protein CQ007_08775 [Pseudomonas sp. MYb185]